MANPMRRAVFVLFAVALLTPVATATAQNDGASVVVAEVDGSMDRTVAKYLGDVIAEAETNGSTLVLQLDSAGTLDEDAVGLAERIHEASVPVIVWIGPAPAKARGAALLFMYAASLGAMAPGAGAGPLTPLDLADRADPTRAELADLIDMWTTERGRSVTEPFPAEPLPAQQALDLGIADVAAVSVVELLEEIDERTVSTATGDVTLQTRIAREESEDPVDVRFVDLGPWDRTLHAAASPTWIYVLMVLGLAGLAFELTQSGLGFAGIASVLMLALAVYGLTVVPFSWLGLVLLIGGVGLMTFEVRARALGAPTFVGLGGFVGGSILLFSGVSDEIDLSPWLIGSATVAALLYWAFGLTVATQSRDRMTATQTALVGLVGETKGELRPEGPVHVKGTLWRARSVDGPIPAGTRVRVRGVDGLMLRVQPEVEADPEHDEP
jgi:membrane-bound serine protease (ClpP class)